MKVELSSDLADRLHEMAERESLSISELVEQVLSRFVASQSDAPADWVQVGQEQLHRVWPAEDFTGWCPDNEIARG